MVELLKFRLCLGSTLIVARESDLPMYKEYFGFKDEPFSIAPDPQFLYMSERHREALGHLVYGLKTNGGFVLLTGEVGTGKTTVCRCLLEQIPEDSVVAFVINPKLTVLELLETVCDELRIDYPHGNLSNKLFIDAINLFLLDAHSKGRKTVLIIDEAQNLSPSVLEQIRLLTNLETNKQKLLQVIMLGQPELKQLLGQPELRQFAQRITARYHLEPLAQHEIKAYVDHRLAVAGVERRLFPAATIKKIYQLSGGIPRLINLLCDRSLLGAYVREQQEISPALLSEAAREIFGEQQRQKTSSTPWRWVFIALLLTIGAGLLASNSGVGRQPQVAVPVKPVANPQLELDRLEWDAQQMTRSGSLAYQSLFKLWGFSYADSRGTVLEQARRHGLSLVSKRGSLGKLRQLDRPVVLILKNTPDDTFFATLTALSAESATLVVGEQSRSVPISALSTRWFGEFVLLWQSPPDYRGSLKPGDRGKLVQWLDQQMATLNGRSLSTKEEPSLTGRLLEEVRQFQKSAGLDPDGVVGPYTLIHLNSRLSGLQPTLSARQKG